MSVQERLLWLELLFAWGLPIFSVLFPERGVFVWDGNGYSPGWELEAGLLRGTGWGKKTCRVGWGILVVGFFLVLHVCIYSAISPLFSHSTFA